MIDYQKLINPVADAIKPSGIRRFFDIVEDMLPFGCGKGRFLGNVAALGTTVEAVLVTVNRKFEK